MLRANFPECQNFQAVKLYWSFTEARAEAALFWRGVVLNYNATCLNQGFQRDISSKNLILKRFRSFH